MDHYIGSKVVWCGIATIAFTALPPLTELFISLKRRYASSLCRHDSGGFIFALWSLRLAARRWEISSCLKSLWLCYVPFLRSRVACILLIELVLSSVEGCTVVSNWREEIGTWGSVLGALWLPKTDSPLVIRVLPLEFDRRLFEGSRPKLVPWK